MASAAAQFAPIDEPGGFETAIEIHKDTYDRVGRTPRTLVELKLCEVIGAIRNREKWWIKVNDNEIVNKWRNEAGAEKAEMFEYALKECRWYASNLKGPVRPAAVDGVYAIENVDSGLLKRLLAGVSRIRELERRDEHPGSDGIVVDHVHPSMYAYEQEVTPVLGGADEVKMPEWMYFLTSTKAQPKQKSKPPSPKVDEDESKTWMQSSEGLMWLPAEFYVRRAGELASEKCEINSYINSLHPVRHKQMYKTISDAFLICLPLFEQVLSELGTPDEPLDPEHRITDGIKYDSELESKILDEDEDEDDDASEDSYFRKFRDTKIEVPKEFTPNEATTPYSLWERPLQVIVKLASIELTPDKPKYDGGSWHVEGMKDERIVATSCMYVESENCTESMLEFRVAVREPEEYQQSDFEGVRIVYGLENGKPSVQPIGASRTLPGHTLCWPNTIQHRVRPFELVDRTKPGKRTILCFFLVDPTLRIRSTATVPPQCREWLQEAIQDPLQSKFPNEVSQQIMKHLTGITYEEACERRERLMNERKQVVSGGSYGDGVFYERPCSLCEH